MRFPQPRPDQIKIPVVNEVPFRAAFEIKAATGVDLYASDNGERIAAVTWWTARTLPEYQGITYDDVLEWSLAQIKAVSRFDDADDVLESAALLPAEPDPVIPEDGASFPLVDP